MKPGWEPWAWAAFALGLGTALLLLLLGGRPGGGLAVVAYRLGPLLLGGASAVVLLIGLAWCLWRRPLLQRRRIVPLGVLAANLWLCSLPIAYPSSHEGHPSRLRFRLPFDGAARVRYGGEARETNPLHFDPARRFGTCFEPLAPGALPVVAPADGRVIESGSGRAGLRVVIELGAGEVLVLEGLDPESFSGSPGTTVRTGDSLGTARRELFVHLQDGPDPRRSEGIPVRFWDYEVDGRRVESGVPLAGQRVSALAVR